MDLQREDSNEFNRTKNLQNIFVSIPIIKKKLEESAKSINPLNQFPDFNIINDGKNTQINETEKLKIENKIEIILDNLSTIFLTKEMEDIYNLLIQESYETNISKFMDAIQESSKFKYFTKYLNNDKMQVKQINNLFKLDYLKSYNGKFKIITEKLLIIFISILRLVYIQNNCKIGPEKFNLPYSSFEENKSDFENDVSFELQSFGPTLQIIKCKLKEKPIYIIKRMVIQYDEENNQNKDLEKNPSDLLKFILALNLCFKFYLQMHYSYNWFVKGLNFFHLSQKYIVIPYFYNLIYLPTFKLLISEQFMKYGGVPLNLYLIKNKISIEFCIKFLKKFGREILQFLFDNGLTQNDVKPENIGIQVLKSNEFKVKLFDIDIANLILSPELKKYSHENLNPLILRGYTKVYASPEILTQESLSKYEIKINSLNDLF